MNIYTFHKYYVNIYIILTSSMEKDMDRGAW